MENSYEIQVHTIITLMDMLYNPETEKEFIDALYSIASDLEKQGTNRLKKYLNENMNDIVKKYYIKEKK